jgi:hypothetical protein
MCVCVCVCVGGGGGGGGGPPSVCTHSKVKTKYLLSLSVVLSVPI